MIPDLSRQAANMTDTSNDYTVTIDEAVLRYAHAGHPRTPRSIQRYCANGHLDSRRIETQFGEKYLIAAASIDKHIAYIEEVRPAASGLDTSRQVVNGIAPQNLQFEARQLAPTSIDAPRLDATSSDKASEGEATAAQPKILDRMMTRLESENEFLRGQISVKDEQIKDLTERARETNVLIGGLQKMLTPLLGTGREQKPDNFQDRTNSKDWRELRQQQGSQQQGTRHST
jgi:hypothetical protein